MARNHIPNCPQSSPKCGVEHSTIEMVVATIAESENNENDNGKIPVKVAEDCIVKDVQTEETFFSIAIQVFIPFLIAGFGMVFAGLVLDRIQVKN